MLVSKDLNLLYVSSEKLVKELVCASSFASTSYGCWLEASRNCGDKDVLSTMFPVALLLTYFLHCQIFTSTTACEMKPDDGSEWQNNSRYLFLQSPAAMLFLVFSQPQALPGRTGPAFVLSSMREHYLSLIRIHLRAWHISALLTRRYSSRELPEVAYWLPR